MADTYEKDLAQKSTLTTSDYIRVVGSDNVSYKQLVSAVMTAMGLDAIKTPATNVANVDTATSTGFYSYAGTATGTKPTAGQGGDLIVIAHSATYSVQVAITYSQTGTTNYIYKRVIVSGTPTEWEKQPTRAELTPTSESLTAGTNITFASNFNNTATKVGSVVTVEFALTSSGAIANGAQIATVPSGYRPTKQVRSACYFTDGYARYAIEPSGKVTTYTAIASGKSVIGTITYIV